jgi:hypothetical protein
MVKNYTTVIFLQKAEVDPFFLGNGFSGGRPKPPTK